MDPMYLRKLRIDRQIQHQMRQLKANDTGADNGANSSRGVNGGSAVVGEEAVSAPEKMSNQANELIKNIRDESMAPRRREKYNYIASMERSEYVKKMMNLPKTLPELLIQLQKPDFGKNIYNVVNHQIPLPSNRDDTAKVTDEQNPRRDNNGGKQQPSNEQMLDVGEDFETVIREEEKKQSVLTDKRPQPNLADNRPQTDLTDNRLQPANPTKQPLSGEVTMVVGDGESTPLEPPKSSQSPIVPNEEPNLPGEDIKPSGGEVKAPAVDTKPNHQPETPVIKPQVPTQPVPQPETPVIKPQAPTQPVPQPETPVIKPQVPTQPVPQPETPVIKPQVPTQPVPQPETPVVKPQVPTQPVPQPEAPVVKPQVPTQPVPQPEVPIINIQPAPIQKPHHPTAKPPIQPPAEEIGEVKDSTLETAQASLYAQLSINDIANPTLTQMKQRLSNDAFELLFTGMLNLNDLSETIKHNGKDARAKLILAMANASKQGIDNSQISSSMKLITESMALEENNPASILKNIILLYLPWYPLQEGVGFKLAIDTMPNSSDFSSLLKVFIQTRNYGNVNGSLILMNANNVDMQIQCDGKFPKDNLLERMKDVTENHTMNSNITVEQKNQIPQDIENQQAKVNMSATYDLNPFLLLMAHSFIKNTIIIDGSANI